MNVASTRARRRPNSGFTLVELLVVISVVALLIALLLPAVASSREMTRRMRCASNLRQLGFAISLYHDRNGVLPPGRVLCYDPRFSSPRPGCTTDFVDKGVFVYVLPEVEQATLYNSINQSLSIFSSQNLTCHTASVSIYSCPSDFTAGFPREIPFDRLKGMGEPDEPGRRHQMVFSSYAGLTGTFQVYGLPRPDLDCQTDPAQLAQNNGVFCDASPITFASITDGLSNTAFLADHATAPFEKLTWPASRLPFEQFGWYIGGGFGSTLATSCYPVNAYKTLPSASVDGIVGSASSLHPGGVNVLFGDGSVRFLSETIDSWPFDPISGNPSGASRAKDGTWHNLPRAGVWQAITTRSGQDAGF